MAEEIKLNENKIKKLEEQIKSQNETQNDQVKVCPECGGENIGVEAESLTPNDYCQDCGFNSIKKDTVKIIHFPTKPKNKTKTT